MPNRCVLVTGAAGFIGSHLCDALLRDGCEVVGLDNFDDFYDSAIKRRNIAGALGHSQFQLIEGDIRDAAVVCDAFSCEPDCIVHLAARAGVRPSIEQPLLYCEVNVRGTMQLLEECRNHPSCKFIFASSSSVYGDRAGGAFRESDSVDNPISPYAAMKRAGELLCHTYHSIHGMNITCLRFFTVYGPRQRPDLAIHKFARLIERGEPVPVFGNGTMARDFTYIDDMVDGVRRAMDRCEGWHLYNLGESRPVTVNSLVATLECALGKRAIVNRCPRQAGDVTHTCADLTLAQRELGYEPMTEFSIGIGRFVSWLRHELCETHADRHELLALGGIAS
ncbi:MAG: NAD-dependent epimerase/dehydratase family protein [Planctomycetes bacterium]|nr:NAD-dependent epimerase/dehydratase family protein [Planctomycetota bacterium]MBI3835187.1 NAD-dependent epimerase/dehydratase family protein [Planctomycetota bacterium]